jgi:hypothetical protein
MELRSSGRGRASDDDERAGKPTAAPAATIPVQPFGGSTIDVLPIQAGTASGTLRADVDPTVVMRVMHGIWYLSDGPEWRADVGRMLDLVIDGLRYRAERDRPRPRTVAQR